MISYKEYFKYKKEILSDKMLTDNNITSKTQTIVNHFIQYFVNIGHTLASKPD